MHSDIATLHLSCLKRAVIDSIGYSSITILRIEERQKRALKRVLR